MANPASEQTLQELLETAKSMSASLDRLSSVLGKPTSGTTGKSDSTTKAAEEAQKNLNAQTSKLAPAVGSATKAMNTFSAVVDFVGGVFTKLSGFLSGLVNIASNVTGILGEFAAAATSGKMQLSDMVQVMGDLANQIPIVGGLFSSMAGLMKFVIVRQEETLTMFRNMAKVGAGIGESLETLRVGARSTGLTMDEYAEAIQNHSKELTLSSGDVEKGRKLFEKNMGAIMGPGSTVSKSLFGLGYTAAQSADLLGLYMATQGTMNKKELDDSRYVAQGTKQLAEQMTYLSEVTGKRREDLEKEIKEAAEEASWKNYVASLDPEAAARANAAVAEGLARAGKDGADAVKIAIRTGIESPVNEAGKKLFVTTQGASTAWVGALAKGARDTTIPLEKWNKSVSEATWEMGQRAGEMNQSVGGVNAILDAQGKGFLNANALNISTQLKQYKDREEFIAKDGELRKKVTEAGKSDAAALAEQQQNLRRFGNIIDNIISTLTGPLLGPILKLTESFQGLATTFAKQLEPYFKEFGSFMGKWVDKFTSIKSWEEFKTVMFAFWQDVKKETGPLIRDVWESVRPVLFDAIKNLFNFLWDALKSAVLPQWMRDDTESEKAEAAAEERKKKEAELERAKKDLANAEQAKERIKKTGGFEWQANLAESAAEKQRKKIAQLEEELKPAAKPATGAASEPAPAVDEATNVRNWAWSLLTGQAEEGSVPASIKDQVDTMRKDPDLAKQASDYREEIRRQAEEKARQEKEAAAAAAKASQQKKPELGTQPVLTPAGEARSSQTSSNDAVTILNKQLAQLISINRDTAEATQRTANLISSNGNLLRRS